MHFHLLREVWSVLWNLLICVSEAPRKTVNYRYFDFLQSLSETLLRSLKHRSPKTVLLRTLLMQTTEFHQGMSPLVLANSICEIGNNVNKDKVPVVLFYFARFAMRYLIRHRCKQLNSCRICLHTLSVSTHRKIFTGNIKPGGSSYSKMTNFISSKARGYIWLVFLCSFLNDHTLGQKLRAILLRIINSSIGKYYFS